MTRSLLDDAFKHHLWATQMLLDTCATLPPEQLQTTVPGTFGSIITTLRHLVASDRGYLRRLLPDAQLERIDEDADLDLAATRVVAGGFAFSGQVAGRIGAVLPVEQILRESVDECVAVLREIGARY